VAQRALRTGGRNDNERPTIDNRITGLADGIITAQHNVQWINTVCQHTSATGDSSISSPRKQTKCPLDKIPPDTIPLTKSPPPVRSLLQQTLPLQNIVVATQKLQECILFIIKILCLSVLQNSLGRNVRGNFVLGDYFQGRLCPGFAILQTERWRARDQYGTPANDALLHARPGARQTIAALCCTHQRLANRYSANRCRTISGGRTA